MVAEQYRKRSENESATGGGVLIGEGQATVADHGQLTGLGDDDHALYLKEKASGGLATEIPLHTHASDSEGGGLASPGISYATTAELVDVTDAAESAGASTTVARGDHKHDITFGALTSWSPTWSTDGTAPSLGSGTLTGRYTQIGKLVFFQLEFQAAADTTFGTSLWHFTIPVANPAASFTFGAWAFDSSLGTIHISTGRIGTSGTLLSLTSSGGGITNLSPMTWATSDRYEISGWYEVT